MVLGCIHTDKKRESVEIQMKKIMLLTVLCLLLVSCGPARFSTSIPLPSVLPEQPANTPGVSSSTNTTALPTFTPAPSVRLTDTAVPSTPTPASGIPNFDHVVLIVLENRGFSGVIGNKDMPYLNSLAQNNVLLTNYYAITHPSLPNYIALVSGSTQNITSDCTNCFVDQPNLADEIESSSRSWKAYLESMPAPCFVGDSDPYAQKHNPFLYFDSIRLNASRCEKSIYPMTQLDADLAANQLPNFSFIMPNLCDSGHDCGPSTADNWINNMVSRLQSSSALGQNSLIIITFDEANDGDKASCCGLGKGGGRVATVLISPQAKAAFADDTEYSHYSLLKTVLTAWNLPNLGKTVNASVLAIKAPWTTH